MKYKPVKYHPSKVWYRMSYEQWLLRVKLLLAYWKIHELLSGRWKKWYRMGWNVPHAVHQAMFEVGIEEAPPATYYEEAS